MLEVDDVQPRMALQETAHMHSLVLSSTRTRLSPEMPSRLSVWRTDPPPPLKSSTDTCQQMAPDWTASGKNFGLRRSFFRLLNVRIGNFEPLSSVFFRHVISGQILKDKEIIIKVLNIQRLYHC